jgi:hypothetical protein
MAELVSFKVFLAERGWRVSRDDHVVAHYPSQSIAEKAAARQARAEANRGNRASAIIYKRDGTVGSERYYTQLTRPWSRRKVL